MAARSDIFIANYPDSNPGFEILRIGNHWFDFVDSFPDNDLQACKTKRNDYVTTKPLVWGRGAGDKFYVAFKGGMYVLEYTGAYAPSSPIEAKPELYEEIPEGSELRD